MASHKSAEKRARQIEKRTERNIAIRTRVKSAVRSFREAVASGDKEAAGKALADATRTIFKAATKGVMHKRAAARRVSRLTLAQNKN